LQQTLESPPCEFDLWKHYKKIQSKRNLRNIRFPSLKQDEREKNIDGCPLPCEKVG